MTTVNRIFQLINENNLTAKEFANKVGVSQGNITDWKTGRANPSVESLKKIANAFNVQLEWLTGDSEYKNKEDLLDEYLYNKNQVIIIKAMQTYLLQNPSLVLTPNNIDRIITLLSNNKLPISEWSDNIDKFLDTFDSRTRNMVDNLIKILLNELADNETYINTYHNLLSSIEEDKNNIKSNYVSNNSFFNCPVYGRISAGQPNWAEECLEGYLPIDPNLMNIISPEECFFLRVNGESMNKVIRNGAYALIRKQDIVENGEIAAVLVNGYDATLKKFTQHNDVIVLEPMSNDPSFQTQIYDKSTEIKILGKYIGKFEINN